MSHNITMSPVYFIPWLLRFNCPIKNLLEILFFIWKDKLLQSISDNKSFRFSDFNFISCWQKMGEFLELHGNEQQETTKLEYGFITKNTFIPLDTCMPYLHFYEDVQGISMNARPWSKLCVMLQFKLLNHRRPHMLFKVIKRF